MAEAIGNVSAGPDTRSYRQARLRPQPVPESVRAVASAMLAIDRIGVPPSVISGLKHAASLANPEFFEKEANRFWTGNTPRFIRCYRETIDQLLLPRGLRPEAERILSEAGSRLDVSDDYPAADRVEFELRAQLRPEQQEALEALRPHQLGVLVAPPGAGKTVMACALMADHQVPTLVIVDRQHLVDQWRDRLGAHLGLTKKQVGHIAGTRKASGIVDIAMAQSLARSEALADLTGGYGLVVVDECHHVPAVTFARAVRQIPVQRWLGLTATPYRRDGLQAMMAMHCGPTRHRMAGSADAQMLNRSIVVHPTDLPNEPGEHIQETFRRLVEHERRTAVICADVGAACASGRNSLVLTRWTEHLDAIVGGLTSLSVEALVLRGGMGKKSTRTVIERLGLPGLRGAVLVATASLLGEGFDCTSLDTVFLAFPIRFKGSVEQYVGRILRPPQARPMRSSTTMSTSTCPCSPGCTRNGLVATRPSGSRRRGSDR